LKVGAHEEYDDRAADYDSHLGCYNAKREKMGLPRVISPEFPFFLKVAGA
jgi:hypothetical protein